jgi:SAM-dependent methyltransferase
MPPAAGTGTSYWESPDVVTSFAAREPDLRLARLVSLWANPSRTRVLDLGCAGGRNTELLARRGFDFLALDASTAMVRATRERLAPYLPAGEVGRRVRVGGMDRLEGIESGSLDLVVALGVFHCAGSAREWNAALDETARVLGWGGHVLVASFTDAMDPGGGGLRPIPGEPHLFLGMGAGPAYLVDGPLLDRAFARRGLLPVLPTVTVSRSGEEGVTRVTANAHYRRV